MTQVTEIKSQMPYRTSVSTGDDGIGGSATEIGRWLLFCLCVAKTAVVSCI